MAPSMTGNESDGSSFGGAGDGNGRRRVAPWGLRVEFGNIRKVAQGVESCSADNSQYYRLYKSAHLSLRMCFGTVKVVRQWSVLHRVEGVG